MNAKLEAIYALINPQWKNIVDVGCDHAYLSLENWLLKQEHVFYNVENKLGPLQNAQRLQSNNPFAFFIYSNGLDYFQDKKIPIDCCIIAGIGGFACVEILKRNQILIFNYLIQVTNNNEQVEIWMLEHNYHVKELKIIKEESYEYWIYWFSK